MDNKPDFTKPQDVRAFLENEFGFCGCSESEPMIETIKVLLAWCGADIQTRQPYDSLFGGNEGVYYILAGIANDLGLIEHGTSIRYPWLEPDGEYLLAALNRFSVQDLETSTGDAYDGTSVPVGGW